MSNKTVQAINLLTGKKVTIRVSDVIRIDGRPTEHDEMDIILRNYTKVRVGMSASELRRLLGWD